MIVPLSKLFIQKFTNHLEHLLVEHLVVEHLQKSQDIDSSRNLLADQLSKMSKHAETLMIWNRKINLTAIKCPLQMAEKHFYDSIMAASFLSNEITSIADIGSGGGFPGIPLKIMNPQIKLLMIDASKKKVTFLKHIIHLLELEDADAVHVRLDRNNRSGLNGQGGGSGESGQDLGNKFDAVISRALTDLESFVDIALPLLKPRGLIYAMKGKGIKKEISKTLTDRFDWQMNHYVLPGENADRYVIELAPG